MRHYSFKSRLTVPSLTFAQFTTMRTTINNWIDGQAPGSTASFQYAEIDDTGGHATVLLTLVVTSVTQAGQIRATIESALTSLPSGTLPAYEYLESEDGASE